MSGPTGAVDAEDDWAELVGQLKAERDYQMLQRLTAEAERHEFAEQLPEMDVHGNVSGPIIDWLLSRIDSYLRCEEADRRDLGR